MDDPAACGLRVLVVDDSEDYVEAVTRLLATYSCVGAVDQALSSGEALARVRANRPDLMLVDVAMPGMNGFDLARAVKAMPSPSKVIIVTLYDTPTYRKAAKDAGADGFLGKSQLGDGLQRAIEQIFPEICSGTGMYLTTGRMDGRTGRWR